MSDPPASPSPPDSLLRYALLIGIAQELVVRLTPQYREAALRRLASAPEGDQLAKAVAHGGTVVEHVGQYLLDECLDEPNPEQAAAQRCAPLHRAILDAVSELQTSYELPSGTLIQVVLDAVDNAMADPPTISSPRREPHDVRHPRPR